MPLAKLKRILLQKGISEEVAEAYYRNVIVTNDYACHMTAEHMAICIELLERTRKRLGPIQVHIGEVPPQPRKDLRTGPKLAVPLFVVAPDWPGLLDTSAGIIHDERFNVHYSQSMVLRVNRRGYGVVIIVVQICSRAELERLRSLRREIGEKLAIAAAKDPGRRSLLRGESRKLSEYSQVVEIMKGIARREEWDSLFSDKGEVVKFFAARSEDYIRERRPRDIAWQILTNHRFLQTVRNEAGGILVKIRDMEIAGRPATGVTVVGLEKEISLGDCLRVIGSVVRGYQRRHDRAFFTADGIIVMRIEIVDSDGKPLSREFQIRLAERLRGMREERTPRELSPGLELLGRKIIPPMLEEERELHIPQVYVHPHRGNEFKVVIVSSGEDSSPVSDAVKELERVPELTCAVPDAPSISCAIVDGKEVHQQIYVVDVWVNFEKFLGGSKEIAEEEEVLLRIEQALKGTEGVGSKFRFFDKTTRWLRQTRWERVQPLAIAAGIDGQLAKAIFNRLGDRRLMDPTVPDREVLRELTLAADVYADFLRSARTRPVLRVGAPESDQAPRGSGTIALVAVAVPQSGHFSPTALSLPPGIRIVTFSRAECGDASIFLFRMSRCAPEAAGPQPLSPDEAKQVLELLTNWPQSTPESCSP